MMRHIKLFENFDDDIRHFRYLDLEILENGDLKISLNATGEQEVDDEGMTEDDFYNYFDDIRANSEYNYFENLSDVELGMSDAPCITYAYYYDDDGEFTNNGNEQYSEVYWYPNYVTTSFTEELKENGFVIFKTSDEKTPEQIEEYRMKKNIKKFNI